MLITRRISSGVVALVGIVLLVSVFANNLFAIGPAFDDLTDGFRPHMTDEALEALQADLGLLGQIPEEFEALAPQLTGALEMEPAQFDGFVGEQFPDVANSLAALPEIVLNFSGLIQTLADQQDNFSRADAIPTDFLPATTIPWGLTVIGFLFVGLGAFMYQGNVRLGAKLTIGLGVAVILGSAILSLTGKSGDADDMNEALKPIYTTETVQGGIQALGVVGNMGNQMQNEMLPGVGEQLQMSPEDVGAFIGEASPTISRALQVMPDAMERFQGLLGAFDTNLDNYDTLRPVSLSPIIWSLLIASVIAVFAAGAVLVLEWRDAVAQLE